MQRTGGRKFMCLKGMGSQTSHRSRRSNGRYADGRIRKKTNLLPVLHPSSCTHQRVCGRNPWLNVFAVWFLQKKCNARLYNHRNQDILYAIQTRRAFVPEILRVPEPTWLCSSFGENIQSKQNKNRLECIANRLQLFYVPTSIKT